MHNSSYSVLECCDFNQVPSHDYLFDLLDKVTTVLEQEITEYRPADSNGNPGGLLILDKDIPSVIVPDIHARPNFIKNILNYSLPKRFFCDSEAEVKKDNILSLLEQNKINCICVGDAFHTERTIDRWDLIQKEFNQGIVVGPYMQQEMTECLASFCALINLKLSFPQNFHFLKGNHENILNVSNDGDCSFYKYADEAAMVKAFISNFYGEDILFLISLYEKLLPLVAKTKKCVVSHAEPALSLTKDEIINVRQNPKNVYSLIWTKNGDVHEETAKNIIKELGFTKESEVKKKKDDILYFVGHRPVKNVYELRQKGKVVQFHNVEGQHIAVVHYKKKFNLEKDFFDVNK